MSEQNEIAGENLYADGEDGVRDWFKQQWLLWPERADDRYTTNISFLYGGVKASRSENGCDPKLSKGMAYNVEFLDRHP